MMRHFFVFLATALLAAGTVASAEQPATSLPLLNAPVAGSDLPDMGSPAAAVLSQSDEYPLIEDPEVSEYINSVGMRLASQSAEGGRYFQYFVIKDTAINAFAVPGGFIFINAGLMLATTMESELA